MCNISDNNDNNPIYEDSHFLDIPFEDIGRDDKKANKSQIENQKRNKKIFNASKEKRTAIGQDKNSASIVKKNKFDGETRNEETAHFVFFDMED